MSKRSEHNKTSLNIHSTPLDRMQKIISKYPFTNSKKCGIMLLLIFNRYRDAGKVTMEATCVAASLQAERGLDRMDSTCRIGRFLFCHKSDNQLRKREKKKKEQEERSHRAV